MLLCIEPDSPGAHVNNQYPFLSNFSFPFLICIGIWLFKFVGQLALCWAKWAADPPKMRPLWAILVLKSIKADFLHGCYLS